MDIKQVKDMRKEIAKALSDLSDGKGYVLKLGNINFSGTGFRGTIICEEMSTDGDCEHPARYKADWDEAVGIGLVKAEWFGIVSGVGSKQYKVVGFDFKKNKMNIMLEKLLDGKIYSASLTHFTQKEFNLNYKKKPLHICGTCDTVMLY